MGGAMGKIGDTMGKLGSSIGNVFTGNGDQIGDSGFSVGDMKDLGYDKAQISDMGATKPGLGTTIARSLVKGTGQGAAQGLQGQGRMQPTGAAPIIPPAPPQNVQSGDPNYLESLTKKRMPNFYGS